MLPLGPSGSPGRDDHEAVRTERNDLQRAGIDGSGDDPDIRHALRDQSHDLVAQSLLQIDRRAGMGREESPEHLR